MKGTSRVVVGCVALLALLRVEADVQIQPVPVAPVGMAEEARKSNLFRGQFTASQLAQRKVETVQLQPGVDLDFRGYLDQSRLTASARFSPLMQANLQGRFLRAQPVYSENILQMTDRFVVERELKVQLQPGVCRAAQAPAAVMDLCVKRKAGKPLPETAGHLKQMRQRLAAAPDNRIVVGEVTAAEARRLSDDDLIDLALNSHERQVRHVTVIPLQVHAVAADAMLKALPGGSMVAFDRPLPLGRIRAIDPRAPAQAPVAVVPRAQTMIIDLGPTTRQKIEEALKALSPEEMAEYFSCQYILGMSKRTLSDEEMLANLDRIRRGARTCTRELARKNREAEQKKAADALARFLGTVADSLQRQPLSYDPRYFLTGFGWGREVEDSIEVTFASETWFTDRYYVRFSYYVGAAFVLRFPYSVTVSASPMQELREGRNALGQGREISVAVDPINVDRAGQPVYPAVGLPKQAYFDGKEFAFGFTARCRLYASLPGPNFERSCPSFEKLWSENLEPVLGSGRETLANLWLNGEVTRLGLSVGIGYAWVDLGVGVDVTRGRIGYRVQPDQGARVLNLNDRDVLVSNTTPVRFGLMPSRPGSAWGFAIDRPQYRFRLDIVPQLRVRVGLDFGIFEIGDTFGPWRFDSLRISDTFVVGAHDNTTAAYRFSM